MSEDELIAQDAYADGREVERKAVVEYLRAVAATRAPSVFQLAYCCLADEIEQGEHVKAASQERS